MTVGAWLWCGLFAAALAWLGRPATGSVGPATTVAAGLCGGFLGGAVVTLITGDRGLFSTLSVCTAAAGATVMIVLVQRASGVAIHPPTPRTAALVPIWTILADPLLAMTIAALAISDLLDWRIREVLAGLVVVLFCYHPRAGLAILGSGRSRTVRQ